MDLAPSSQADPSAAAQEWRTEPLSDDEVRRHADDRLTHLANKAGSKLHDVIVARHAPLSGALWDRRTLPLMDEDGVSCSATEEENESGLAPGYALELDGNGDHLLIKYMPGHPPRLHFATGLGVEGHLATADGHWHFDDDRRRENEHDPRRRNVRELLIRARLLLHQCIRPRAGVKPE